MPLRQHYESLLLFDPHRSPTTANVWISRPSPSEETALGKLLVISSVESADRLNLDVINLLQEELRTGYYQSIDLKPERAFESALQLVNHRLHHIIADGVGQWVEAANILVAAVWREVMIVSVVGTVHAFLLRHGRMHDILEPNHSAARNPVRLFSHLISGQLQAEDQVLLCTSSLLDYFSPEKLRRTMLDVQPSAAVAQWESTLLGIEQRASFAAVVIQSLAPASVPIPASRPTAQATLNQSAPQVSMEHLIAKEQATERLLTPSIWPAIRDVFSQINASLGRLVRRVILRKPPRRIVSSGTIVPSAPPLPSRTWWSAMSRALRRGTDGLVDVLRRLFTRPSTRSSSPPPVTMSPVLRRQWRPSLNSLVVWFQRLTRRQQFVLVLVVVAIALFAVSIIPKTLAPSSNTTATAITAAINDHLVKARAALLYGGQTTAEQDVTAAQTLVAKLPNRRPKDKAARQALQEQIDGLLAQLSKRTIVNNPATVVQLATVAPTAQPQQLYLVGTQVVTVDPQHAIVTTVTIGKSQSAETVPNQLDTGTPLTGTAFSTSTLMVVTDRLGFVEINLKTGGWKPIDSAWPKSTPRVQALASYLGRLYALDANHSAIIRFSRSANSFGTGTSWLKESADLAAARDMAVDGAVYILQPHGQVERYANGRRSVFTLATINPPLSQATRIRTDSDSTYLYLVDPSHHRIVVYSKTGQLIDQYESSAWQNLHDLAVSEKNKTAYVLSGTTISSITLLH